MQSQDDTQTAFRTEPPLIMELFEFALKNYFGEEYRDKFSEDEGLFIVARTAIPAIQIEQYEQSLPDAEKFLANQQGMAEKEREDTLQERAKMAGLPLE